MNFPVMREAFVDFAATEHTRRRGSPLHSSVQRALAVNDKQQRRPNGRQQPSKARIV